MAWADATIMGGGTLRIHKNTCLIHNKELIEKRLSEGRSKQPISLIVSNSIHSQHWPYFQQPIRRMLISANRDAQLTGYESLIIMKRNWKETLNTIHGKGIYKIVLLGGAKLIGSFFIDESIDELQLTFTPKIIGGECTWLPTNIINNNLKSTHSQYWLLSETKRLGNSELLVRYLKPSNPNLSINKS